MPLQHRLRSHLLWSQGQGQSHIAAMQMLCKEYNLRLTGANNQQDLSNRGALSKHSGRNRNSGIMVLPGSRQQALPRLQRTAECSLASQRRPMQLIVPIFMEHVLRATLSAIVLQSVPKLSVTGAEEKDIQ